MTLYLNTLSCNGPRRSKEKKVLTKLHYKLETGPQTSGTEDDVNVTASQRQSCLIPDNLTLPVNIITLRRSRLRFKAQALLEPLILARPTAG